MAWTKFDDRTDDNRKVKKAWRLAPRAVGLWFMASTYSSRHELDGRVDVEWLHEKLPDEQEYERTISALVDAGLFDEDDGEHFVVHDYLDHNPSRAELEAKRARDRERKAAGGRRRPSGVRSDSKRNPEDHGGESGSPVPTRPDPSRPSPDGDTARGAVASSEALEVCKLMEGVGLPFGDPAVVERLIQEHPQVDVVEAARKAAEWAAGKSGVRHPLKALLPFVTAADAPEKRLPDPALARYANVGSVDDGSGS